MDDIAYAANLATAQELVNRIRNQTRPKKKIYFVIGHLDGSPGNYWTIHPYIAHHDEAAANQFADAMNTIAFDKDTAFRFRVESLSIPE